MLEVGADAKCCGQGCVRCRLTFGEVLGPSTPHPAKVVHKPPQ